MSKIKFKVGISYIFLVLISLVCNKTLLIINYTLVLFLHELAHYYVAKSKGYRVNNVKLDLLGMKLSINQNVDKNDRFWIAFAGPLVNFILCIICAGLWWFVPESYYFTADFFTANLLIAVFNILPIEPLDGGVMLNSLLSKAKQNVANTISKILNIVFIVLFLILFFISFDTTPNYILLLFAVFFIVNMFKTRKKNEYEMFYSLLLKRNKPITKVNLLKIDAEVTLLECYKKIEDNTYTIFYFQGGQSHYITEIELRELISKYNLQTKIKDIIK